MSASTVSNVINGRDDRMRAETRQRVLVAIERLKFTPNSAARQLKSGQNTTLGLVIPSAANPFWGSVAHHVERAARAIGYRLLICNAERDRDVEARYVETLLGSGISGVILGSSPLNFDHLRDMMSRGLRLRPSTNGSTAPGMVSRAVSALIRKWVECSPRSILSGSATGASASS